MGKEKEDHYEFCLAADGTERPPSKPTIWSTRIGKIILLVITILVAIILALAITIFCREMTRPKKMPPVCETVNCVKLAMYHLDRLNGSEDPCQDFEKYTCGRLSKKFDWLQQKESHMSTSEYLQRKSYMNLRDVIMSPLAAETGDQPLKELKEFFTKCVSNYSDNSGKFYRKIVDFIGGVYGSPNFNITTSKKLGAYMGKLRKFGINLLYQVEIALNISTLQYYNIEIRESNLLLQEKRAYKSDMFDIRYAFIYRLLETFYQYFPEMNITREKISFLVNDIMTFENTFILPHISESSSFKEFMLNRESKFETLSHLHKDFPELGLRPYLDELLSDMDTKLLDDNLKISVPFKPYLTSIRNRLLEGLPSSRALGAYAAALISKVFQLGPPNESPGDDPYEFGWFNCIHLANQYIPVITTNVFANNVLNEETIEKIIDIIDTVKETFKFELKNSYPWLKKYPRSFNVFVDKLDAMRIVIGYDKDLKNPNTVIAKIGGLLNILKEKDFSTLLYRVVRYDIRSKLALIDQPREIKIMSSAEVNSVYMLYNTVFILGGLMTSPVFEVDYPGAIKFSGIGVIAAHEILHGYDHYGMNRNSSGGLVSHNVQLVQIFNTRFKCFEKQYEDFIFTNGLPLEPSVTSSSDLVDNAAVNIAYKAYLNWKKKYPEEVQFLPGLGNFTDEQLFFLHYASFFCEYYPSPILNYTAATRSHSPGRLRILGPLANSPYFASSYRCSKKDAMVNEKPCKIW